jgi:type IV pilus assembly protein PilV
MRDASTHKHGGRGHARAVRGFTLVEALVALLALSIGLLGVAGLQLIGLRANMGSSLRSTATYLSLDILDRMRGNRDNIEDYEIALGGAPATAGTAQIDLVAWQANLAALLPAAKGAITVDDVTNEVTVIVEWDDSRGADPTPLQFVTSTRL